MRLTGPERTTPPLQSPDGSELFETIGLVSNMNPTAHEVFPGGERFLFLAAPQGTGALIVRGWVAELERRPGCKLGPSPHEFSLGERDRS